MRRRRRRSVMMASPSFQVVDGIINGSERNYAMIMTQKLSYKCILIMR